MASSCTFNLSLLLSVPILSFLPDFHFRRPGLHASQHLKLQLNADKAEMILITSKYNQTTQTLPSAILLHGCDMHLSTSVRNLAAILDHTLFPATHIPYMPGFLPVSSSVESVLSVIISLTMILKLSSTFWFCLVLITVTHFSRMVLQ